MKELSLGLLFTFAFLLSAVVAPVTAQSSAADNIRQMLVERDQEIKQILGDDDQLTDEEREKLQKVVNENIDFNYMGRQALGRHWEKLSEKQRTRFLETFTEIVREQSLSNIRIYRANVTYEDISVQDDTAHVTTLTAYDDIETPVAYDLIRENGDWKVVDIVIDGVGTVESYARSFQTVIRKRGFDTLMKSLDKKLADMRAEKS